MSVIKKRQGLLAPLVSKPPEESQECWEGEELQQKVAKEGNRQLREN